MTYKMVLVKGADGDLTPFALLNATPSAVFVCRKERYEDIVSGRREPPMIGFPIEDVFTTDREPFSASADVVRDAA